MSLFFTVLHVVTCLVLIAVVLLQRGKGAEIGAVFGGGASSTVFGARGAGNFLTKLTTGAAIVFMISSLALSYLSTTRVSSTLFDEEAARTAPAAPGESPAAEGGEGASPFVEVEPPATGGEAAEGGSAPAAEGEAATPEKGAAPSDQGEASPPAESPAP